MRGLVDKPGRFRLGAVGILKGSQVSHIAPKAMHVPALIDQLLGYLNKSKELDLIKSCVFHYEFEFIHPFEDGNGRIGRLWQTLILSRYNPIFEFIPIESQIFSNQREYYKALETCDKKGDSTYFIEWMLSIILGSLREFSSLCLPEVENFESRIENARTEFGRRKFTRQDYMRIIKTVSAPTASRDLATAVQKKILVKIGDKRTTQYSFV
jgi:Fic family protein